MVLLPLSPPIIIRRLLCASVIEIMIKSSRSPFKVLTAWDAIDLEIHVRVAITRITQTSIVVDLGMDAKQIKSSRQEA